MQNTNISTFNNGVFSQVYQSEQDAERATHNGDYVSAVHHHNNAITKLNMLVTKLIQRDVNDEFGVVDSLVVLKNQINTRMNQLQTLIKNQQLKKTGSSANDLNTRITKPETLNSLGSTKEPPMSNSSAHTIPSNLENASVQLFNSTVAEIETSLLKNLNINIADVPNTKRAYKVPLINKTQINQLEHSLQLLNFKGSSDLKLRNDYLSKLNMLYYSELLADHEVIKDVVSVVKDLESGMENNKKWVKVNQITDDSVYDTIGELQQRISTLEREKLQMENEIVKLKERWNTLIEGARRRKEQEKEFQTSQIGNSSPPPPPPPSTDRDYYNNIKN